VISDLRRQINPHPDRDAQDIQKGEERMAAQMPEHVPAKDAKILGQHGRFTVGLTIL
jgi:hypothetical protein